MKNRLVSLSPRAALFIGAALLSTPAFAQDGAQDVAPPPVVTTTAPAPAPAPAQPRVTFAPATPQVQTVPEAPVAETPARAEPRAAARPAATTRQTTRTTATRTAPAPQAAAPQAETPAPVAEAPLPPVAALPEPLPEVAPPTVEAQQTVTTETSAPAENPVPVWPWLLLGALIVAGAVVAMLMRRRSAEDPVYEEAYEPVSEPVAERVAEPVVQREAAPTFRPRHEPEVSRPAAVAAAPIIVGDTLAADSPAVDYGEPSADAELHDAEKDDLAGLTDKAPVAARPWLEFGMRPVRAGTSADEALVEIELTVGNAGDQPAKDVRISTFMLADGDTSHMEELLIERGGDATVPPVTINPGEGTRVDATLAVRKDTLEGEFAPVVVADARYTMADGSEGRTSATFRVGLWNGTARLEPIAFDRPEMHRDIAAELVGKPAHA
jgi:hypothetical protein